MASAVVGELREETAGCLDHVMLHVKDLKRTLDFYLAALAPLKFELIVSMEAANAAGIGSAGKPQIFFHGGVEHTTDIHLALSCNSTEVVKAFHEAALKAGGVDHGAPGPRPHYHPGYYGAFVLDPDGNNLEVVFHGYTP